MCADIDQYERVCKRRFDDIASDVTEIKQMTTEMYRHVFVGNGQPAINVRVAQNDKRLDALEKVAHPPQAAPRRIVWDFGKAATGGGIVVLVQQLLELLHR